MANVLLVVGDGGVSPLGSGDQWIHDRLETLGHTCDPCTVAQALNDALSTYWENYDLLYISSTCSSATVGTNFFRLPVPIINAEAAADDDFRLADQGTNGSINSQSGLVPTGSHPIVDGISGPLITSNLSVNYTTAIGTKPSGGNAGTVLATFAGAFSAVVWERGEVVNWSVFSWFQVARRAIWWFNDTTASASNLTASGIQFFDQLIEWMLEEPADQVKVAWAASNIHIDLIRDGDPYLAEILHDDYDCYFVPFNNGEVNDTEISAANGYGLFVAPETAFWDDLPTSFDPDVPVITCEAQWLVELGFASTNGVQSSVTAFTIDDDTHPITTGLGTGSYTTYGSTDAYQWFTPSGGTFTALGDTGTASQVVLAWAERTAKWVFLGFDQQGPEDLSEDGETLFAQSVDWALESEGGEATDFDQAAVSRVVRQVGAPGLVAQSAGTLNAPEVTRVSRDLEPTISDLWLDTPGAKLIIDGDSNSAPGWGGNSGKDVWTEVLGTLLSANGHEATIANFAVAGSRVQNLVDRAATVDAAADGSVNVLLVMCCTNNLLLGWPPSGAAGDFESYLTARAATGNYFLIVVVQIPDIDGTVPANDDTNSTEVNAFNALVAAGLDGADTYVPRPTEVSDATDSTYFETDGVHLKDPAHAALAEAVYLTLAGEEVQVLSAPAIARVPRSFSPSLTAQSAGALTAPAIERVARGLAPSVTAQTAGNLSAPAPTRAARSLSPVIEAVSGQDLDAPAIARHRRVLSVSVAAQSAGTLNLDAPGRIDRDFTASLSGQASGDINAPAPTRTARGLTTTVESISGQLLNLSAPTRQSRVFAVEFAAQSAGPLPAPEPVRVARQLTPSVSAQSAGSLTAPAPVRVARALSVSVLATVNFTAPAPVRVVRASASPSFTAGTPLLLSTPSPTRVARELVLAFSSLATQSIVNLTTTRTPGLTFTSTHSDEQ